MGGTVWERVREQFNGRVTALGSSDGKETEGTSMSENDEQEEHPGVLDGVQEEIATNLRSFEILQKVLEEGPIGITKVSNELGYPHHKVRYSFRALESEGLIDSTEQGAAPTERAINKIEAYNQKLDQLQSCIISAGEILGAGPDVDTSSAASGRTEQPLDEFILDAPLDAIVGRFDSFVPLLEHENVKIRQAAVERLREISEDEEPDRIIQLASVETIADRIREDSDDIVRPTLSLLSSIADDNPAIIEPALSVLFERIGDHDVPAFVFTTIELFGDIAGVAPDTAHDVIQQHVEQLPEAGEKERVDIAQSLNGAVASEPGIKLLEPFISDLVELLDDPSKDVRVPIAGMFREIVNSDANLLNEYHGEIVELLNDDSPEVREIAIRILENLTLDIETITTIRQLAEEDPNENVRTAASDLLKEWGIAENNSTQSANMSEPTSDADTTDRSESASSPETESSPSSASRYIKNETEAQTDEISIHSQLPTSVGSLRHGTIDLTYDQFQFDEDADLIGAGGQAHVYRAEVPDEDLTVALKQPSFNTTISTDTYDRILSEARNWSQWDDHPHIVQVFDWGTEPGPWIALEYMDGGSLNEYIGAMSVQQRLWTVYSIASAVAHANTKGLAHHDIKPNNILFRKTPDDKWDVPKVADWGLSREIIKATSTISQATPDYAAPEHFGALMPDAPVDERTDVYQLGVVAYEILTGIHPSHLRGDVPAPTEINNSLPESADNIISTAITHDRTERFEHSLLFRREVEKMLSNNFPGLLDT